MKNAKGKYFFLLNSDTILLNNAIKIFFNFMEQSKLRIGALGSIMFDSDYRLNYKNSFNYFPSIFNLFRINFSGNINKYFHYEKKLLERGMFFVDFIVGADLFLNSKVISKIGNFDADFFLYWEEVDLQKRMSNLGYHRIIISGPKIIHLEGGSSHKGFNNWKRITHDSHLLLYARKNFSYRNFLMFKILFILKFLLRYFSSNYTKGEQISYFRAIINS